MIDRACISINDNCNLQCRYCHFNSKQFNDAMFSDSDLAIILSNIHTYCELNSIQKFKLGIVGAGEPLLNQEHLFKLLNIVKTKGYSEISMYTITNGVLLNRPLLDKLLAYNDILKVCISLDGYEDLHNYGRSHFSSVMNSIDLYKEVFGKSPSINATVNRLTINNMEKTINFFISHDLIDVTFSQLFAYYEDDLSITRSEFLSFLEYAEAKGIKSRQFRKSNEYDCTMYGKMCGVGRNNVFITPDGIYPCGRFYKLDKYRMCSAVDTLQTVEELCKKLTPAPNGQCYFMINEESL